MLEDQVVIPYGRQCVDEDDVVAVTAVLRGDWLTSGPEVRAFEESVAERVGARFAVAYSSGTAGLHGATAAAGLGPGDLVATPSMTFVASANCARYVGAEVIFVDIEDATMNLDPALVPESADALVAVHYAGLPFDLSRLARRPRVVIEDAAHALGAIGPLGPIGNCAASDMCVFSFHPVKPVTSAEGGVVTTNSPELAERLRRFRNHGMHGAGESPEAPWAYRIDELAMNYRLSDLHAALGRSQMAKLDRFTERREQLARRYDEALADTGVRTPPAAPAGQVHARHLYPVRVPERLRVYRALRAADIGVQVHYVPVHHQPLYADVANRRLPVTDAVYEQLLSLPLHPGLTDRDQDQVLRVLAEPPGTLG
jgi:dTDP-4-amino-4,6-dideoxygalactose transaminase